MLVYCAVRLAHIGLFPAFVDEVGYITWTRSINLGSFSGAAYAYLGGKPLLPWLIAPFMPLQNGLWIARVVIVLMGVPALAAILMTGRTLFDSRVALSAGVIYTLLPLAFFYDRLMMSDPMSADLGMVAIWLSILSVKSRRPSHAILAGIIIGTAMLVKLSTGVVAAAPLLAAGLLVPRRDWIIGTLARIYAIPAAIVAVLAAGLGKLTAYGMEITVRWYVTDNSLTIFQRAANAASDYLSWMQVYVGLPVLILAAVGFVWGIIRRDRPTLVAGLLLGLIDLQFAVVGGNPFPRYYLLGMALLVLLACAAAWQSYDALRRRSSRGLAEVPILGLAALVAAPMLGFIVQAYTAPQDLPLPQIDREDYIRDRFAGFGAVDAAAWLKNAARTGRPLTILCAHSLVCDRLDIYLYGTPGIEYASIDMVSPGWLADQTASRSVFVPDDELAGRNIFDILKGYHLTQVGRYPRPGGETVYTLYQVTP